LLSALWTAQALLARAGPVLVIALEAPSHHLRVEPGPSAEAAALFGDGAAAAVLCDRAVGRHPVPLAGVILGADGGAGDLLQVRRRADNRVEVHMDGPALAGRAITMMAEAAVRLATRHGLRVSDVEALVVHGGNGRMPGLLARHLGVPLDKVWSETPHAGNLGSVSLPAAWAAHAPPPQGPVLWTAVGAGLTWAAAITGVEWD
jgi:3-oxoacyl-[acyl-carrier-protein] synthase III